MLRSLFGLLAINGQKVQTEAGTQTEQSCSVASRFPPLGPSTAIWMEVTKVPFKMAGIFAGDEPLNRGRISFLWVEKTQGINKIMNHIWKTNLVCLDSEIVPSGPMPRADELRWEEYLTNNSVCLTWSAKSPKSAPILEINSKFLVKVVINNTGKSLLVIDQKLRKSCNKL